MQVANYPEHLQAQVEGYEIEARRILKDDDFQPENHPWLVHRISRALERNFWEGVFRERTNCNAMETIKLMDERERWMKERDAVIAKWKEGKP